ncbi:MAG: hypothetical protein ACD_50C00205G0004 [uncultured bacterium]|nr:MAG: hypothetical protein ACD_50C00205G0004 [uncultured bacterium]OGH13114.1 MAG: hypothetical protein A2687_00445 [Candidatus Levybacteria bacterium RIFCSPHIGHO2_01_FULL_38_26]
MKSYLPKKMSKQKGFTLIELLVVIGILAVLLAITLIAINPARQFANANNTQRRSDVNQILNSIGQYSADNRGDITALGTISSDPLDPTQISNTTVVAPATSIGNAFCTTLVTEYIAALPSDPLTNTGTPVLEADCVGADTWDTGYTMYRSATDNRITVIAPGTELNDSTPAIIEVTR